MKASKFLVIVFLFFISVSFTVTDPEMEIQLLGTWKWVHLINSETNEIAGLEQLTMGMAKEVKTEFKADSIYIEYKNTLNSNELSSNKGLWYYDKKNNALMMKPKDKWLSSKIVRFSKDTIVLEMMKPMNLLMIREK